MFRAPQGLSTSFQDAGVSIPRTPLSDPTLSATLPHRPLSLDTQIPDDQTHANDLKLQL